MSVLYVISVVSCWCTLRMYVLCESTSAIGFIRFGSCKMDGEDSPSSAAGRGPGLVGYMEILLMPAWFALRFAAIAAAFVFCCVLLLLLPRLSYKIIGAFAALFFVGILLLFQDSNWFSAECFHLCRSLFFFFFFLVVFFSENCFAETLVSFIVALERWKDLPRQGFGIECDPALHVGEETALFLLLLLLLDFSLRRPTVVDVFGVFQICVIRCWPLVVVAFFCLFVCPVWY